MKFLAVFMLLVGMALAMPRDYDDTVDARDAAPAVRDDDWFHKWIHGHSSSSHVTTHVTHFHHSHTVTKTITQTTVIHSQYQDLLHKCNTKSYNARRRCQFRAHAFNVKIHDIQHVLHTIVHHVRYYRYRYSVCHHSCFKSCNQILSWYTGYLYNRHGRKHVSHKKGDE